jgi:ApaG protein
MNASPAPRVASDPQDPRHVAPCIGSESVTRAIRVLVDPSFVPDQSDPAERRYLFNYRIRVANEGDRAVQLIGRHWIIVDAHGRREEVTGQGVVGRQPALQPGQSFTYESFCPLPTHWGTMEGTYQLRDLGTGELFDVEVKRFHLVTPTPAGVPAPQPTGPRRA